MRFAVVAMGVVGLSLALGTTPADAGTVQGLAATAGPIVVRSHSIRTPHPNKLHPRNRIGVRGTVKGLDPIDLVFSVKDSSGATGYLVDLKLKNFSDETWDGFKFQVGYGKGEGFQLSPDGDGLAINGDDELSLAGSWRPSEILAATLRLVVPANLPPLEKRRGKLTLRGQAQASPMPEPGAALLFALGALLVGRAVSRRP